MLMIREGAKITMMRSVVPSYPQKPVFILPVIRIEETVKGKVLFNVKLAIIYEHCSYLEEVEILSALEVQDLKALDEIVMEQF